MFRTDYTDATRRFWPALVDYGRCLVGAMPGRVLLAAAVTVAQGGTEGISFLLLVPLLAAVGIDVGGGVVGTLGARVQSVFAWLGVRPTLGSALIVYVAAVSLQALCSRSQLAIALAVEHRFVATLRNRLYSAIARADWRYLSGRRPSDLGHVLTQELDRVGIGTYQVLSLFSNAVIASVYLALALRLSTTMTLIVGACGGLLLAVLGGRVRTARNEGEAVSRATGRLFSTAVEYIASLRIAKSYGAEARHIAGFAAAADEVADAHVQAIRTHAGSRMWFDVGAVVALALMLYVGLVGLRLPAASVLLLLYVFARTMPRLSAIQQAMQNVSHYLASYQVVASLQQQADAHEESAPAAAPPVRMTVSVALDCVTFVHDAAAQGAVRDVSLEIAAGSVTAIVGQSGAGKSTVGDLLAGLQRPAGGRLLVDGHPLDAAMLAAWRRQVGYVDQDTFLFNDTVRANLRWANPDATESALVGALTSSASEFVFELPQGLDTIVGDRGTRLSGGERQRLALARALVRQPQLLLLDEATSALDSENENRILDAIDELRGRTTIVIITHRLAAVRRADMIHVLHDGRLVESGDWGTLTARRAGRFRALCEAQGVEASSYRRAPAIALFESR